MKIIFMSGSRFGLMPLLELNDKFDIRAVFVPARKPKKTKSEVSSISAQPTLAHETRANNDDQTNSDQRNSDQADNQANKWQDPDANIKSIKNSQENIISTTAKALGIEVVEVESMKDLTVLAKFNETDADLVVVASYGFILRKEILYSKKYGCINIHPSDLPQLRGASPIQQTILNRLSTTKVCIMQMDEGIDTGDILMESEVLVPREMDYQELESYLSEIGAQLLVKTLENIEKLVPKPQVGEPSYAHKITKADGLLNLYDSILEVEAKIKAFNPWPSVYFIWNNKIYKIIQGFAEELYGLNHELDQGLGHGAKDSNLQSHNAENNPSLKTDILKSNISNRILIEGSSSNPEFKIALKDGYINITKIQPEGKKVMTAREFINGLNSQSN